MLNLLASSSSGTIFSPSFAAINHELVVITLYSLGDLAEIAEIIRSGKIAILILTQLDSQTYKRILNWLNGYVYALNGVSQWLGEKTFLFASKQVDVIGKSKVLPSLKSKEKVNNYKKLIIELGDRLFLEMMAIPPGTFLMGSPLTDSDSSSDERPQHLVKVPQFYLSTYPVTQKQWQIVATFPRINIPLNSKPAYFPGDNLPVEQVSWYEVMEFCDRLSQQTGRIYRLPSEAEWEYACRGRTLTKFWFGNYLSSNIANYDARGGNAIAENKVFLGKTTCVGYFSRKNPFGLGDLHGLVWEWCGDHWHNNYDEAPNDGSAWLSNYSEQYRVIRGGSWYDLPRFCRAACRSYLRPHRRLNRVGFRLAANILS